MTDEELLIWLRVEDTNLTDCAADRIEALIAELNTCRMAQAVMDNTVADLEAKLTKAVEERDEAIRRRDAWKAKAEGYDAVRKALREKVGAPWPPNLSRALWAGIAADEKKRADDAEAKLAKAVEVLSFASNVDTADWSEALDIRNQARATLAEIKGESHD